MHKLSTSSSRKKLKWTCEEMSNFPVEKLEILQGHWWLTCHPSPHSSTNWESGRRLRDSGKHLMTPPSPPPMSTQLKWNAALRHQCYPVLKVLQTLKLANVHPASSSCIFVQFSMLSTCCTSFNFPSCQA